MAGYQVDASSSQLIALVVHVRQPPTPPSHPPSHPPSQTVEGGEEEHQHVLSPPLGGSSCSSMWVRSRSSSFSSSAATRARELRGSGLPLRQTNPAISQFLCKQFQNIPRRTVGAQQLALRMNDRSLIVIKNTTPRRCGAVRRTDAGIAEYFLICYSNS